MCQFTDFVTRFSNIFTPLGTFFKSLATKSIYWTNLIYIPRLTHDVVKASSLIYINIGSGYLHLV